MLDVGDPVPAFELESSTGETVSPAALRGHRWVIYFYPKDDTPGCTIETRAFGQALGAFAELGVRVFGCSIGDVAAKRSFAATCEASDLPLLADPDHAVSAAFGTWGERSFAGRRFMGVARSTFAIGADGRVAAVWPDVSPAVHTAEVLTWLRDGGAAATA
ncbi:MAG TPA: peroxiredoxin [Candidatus Micrarchaeia archaeon]|nr:peroxiredoxin [Candidatus Micrarchaeia archaeon]